MLITKMGATIAVALSVTVSAYAHGGALDRNGCHTDHKTGKYHCHSKTALPTTRALTNSQHSSPGNSKCPETISEEQLAQIALHLLKAMGVDIGPSTGSVLSDASLGVQMFEASRGRTSDGRITGELLVELSQSVAKDR